MVGWIKLELGNNTVLHLSRYHPAYKLNIEPTTRESLEGLYSIAREKLHYVYVGNLLSRDFQDTFCSQLREESDRPYWLSGGHYTPYIRRSMPGLRESDINKCLIRYNIIVTSGRAVRLNCNPIHDLCFLIFLKPPCEIFSGIKPM